jgi:hypothetical protein
MTVETNAKLAAPSSGSALKLVGGTLIVAGGLLYAALGDVEENPAALAVVPILFVGFLLYYRGHFRGRQHAAKARAASRTTPIHDYSKPEVLYLRSFQADISTTRKIVFAGLTTDEEQLAEVLRPFGDLIAIGRPGEPLPVPGADRMYATDSEWKDLVIQHMRAATLVIIRAGTGAGLLWEFEQAVSTLRPERVVVFVFNVSKAEYDAFARQARERLGVALPLVESNSLARTIIDVKENPLNVTPGFIRFSDDWSAQFLPLPRTVVRLGYNDYKKSFSLALRPVFERNGVAWQPVKQFG